MPPPAGAASGGCSTSRPASAGGRWPARRPTAPPRPAWTTCRARVALDQALLAHGAKIVSLAPGVIDTDMQVQLRSSDGTGFPDRANFVKLKEAGQLTSSRDAAARLVAYLGRADFGAVPVADVRDS